jgi:biotin transporter BioY
MVVTGNGIGTAASMAVLPFIPVDLFKCIVAALLVKRLTSILPKGYNIHI